MKNSHLNNLIDSNLSALDSISALLSSLASDRFTQVQRPYFESSLGKHVRHILDHYLCFLRDLNEGLIDYDQRMRDCQLETDRDYALTVVGRIKKGLDTLRAEQVISRPLRVLMCNDVDVPNGEVTPSTLGRELQFLQGHSVHHFAIMAVMLRISGDKVVQDFGVAPSTLVHEKTVKESA